mgnify:FL=1
MTLRQRTRALYVSAIGIAAAALLVCGWGALAPARVAEPGWAPSSSAGVASGDPVGNNDTPPTGRHPQYSLVQLQRVASMNLRPSLFPQAQPASSRPQAVQPARALSIQLLGTVIEPGKSMALFEDSDRSIKLMFEGETADTLAGLVTVNSIEPRRVVIEHGGATHELAMPEEPEAGGRP